MAKQPCSSDADDRPVYKSVFIATSLQTHLAVMVSCADTVSELKSKIQYEHRLSFPNFGNIKIEAIKVKIRGHFYHLSESMILGIAFDGLCNKRWFVHVDISMLLHDAPTHKFLVPDSNVKNTVVSHLPCNHSTSLSNFDNGAEPSTYDHDQILLDISSPEKQGHSVMDFEVPSGGTRCEADESGRKMIDSQLKVYATETANVVSVAKKKHKIKETENSSGDLPKAVLLLHTSSTPDVGRETVSDDDVIKKEALSGKNTSNVDGDVEEHPPVKPSNIGEEVGTSADENTIIDHCQEVGTCNDNGDEEGQKTPQKQDSKSILSEVIKPSDEYDSDVRINQTSGFSKHSDTNMTVDPQKSSRRKKKKTEGSSGAIIDGLVEGCMSKGEGVLTEFGNLVDLGQSSKIGDKQNEILTERQEENVIREVIPAKYKGKGAANQKGNVCEKDGGLEQLKEAQEIVENKDKKKKSKKCRSSESKIPDGLRKDGRIGDISSEDHHNRSLVEASKSKTFVGENRSHTVQASTKLPYKHKNRNRQLSLDKLNPTKNAFGSGFGPNHTVKKRSLLANSGPIFKDDSSESLGDEGQLYSSNWSTRTQSENSLSSAYSDGESNADSLIDKNQENGASLARAELSNKKAMTIENVLRSSKRYKKAKLIASQMEDTEMQPPGFIPDSQADT